MEAFKGKRDIAESSLRRNYWKRPSAARDGSGESNQEGRLPPDASGGPQGRGAREYELATARDC